MTKRNNIYSQSDLRKAIERWYDGTATPAEQDALVEYFASSDEADIPAHFRDEAPVFRAIGSRSISPDKALLAEIDAVIAADTPSKKRVGRIPHIAGWFSIAAAASVAVILTVGLLNQEPISLDATPHGSIVAQAPGVKNDTLKTAKNEDKTVTVETPHPEKQKKAVKTKARPKTTMAKPEKDDIIFIDDVDQAAEILAMVNNKIEKFGTIASEAVNNSFKNIPDINRELEKAPDYKSVLREACSNMTLPTI